MGGALGNVRITGALSKKSGKASLRPLGLS